MTDTAKGSPVETLKESVAGSPATDRLKEAATAFASAQAQRLLVATGRRLGEATARLEDVAQGGGKGLVGPVLKDTVKGALKDTVRNTAKKTVKGVSGKLTGGRKGGGKGRFVTIVEDIDVGVPVREAYDQWTQFQEFSAFAKGVQGVESADETTTNWRAKIWWSTRSWKADTTEQIPDRRIAWTSEGAKGTVKGVVTFHELADSLTRVLLVLEYHPKGLFEKTGNIWRAQGRRARLDLKHFRRFVTLRGEASGAWRGEIHDGEVVRGHAEAVEEEEEARAAREEEPEEEYVEDTDTEDPEYTEDAEETEDADDSGGDVEGAEDDYEDEDAEDAEDADDELEDVEEDEYEPEPAR